jgi:hypothetical protein
MKVRVNISFDELKPLLGPFLQAEVFDPEAVRKVKVRSVSYAEQGSLIVEALVTFKYKHDIESASHVRQKVRTLRGASKVPQDRKGQERTVRS